MFLIGESYMDNLKLTLGIEPTDKYKKAKMDLIQDRKSFFKLTQREQRMLVEEFVGVEYVVTLLNIFHQAFGR